MPGSWGLWEFPFLDADRYTLTSEVSKQYNCFAWAAGDVLNNWGPDPMDVGFWPAGARREDTIPAAAEAYETLGYKICADGSLEAGVEKIAIFGVGQAGSERPTHAARQLQSGEWTSKMGPHEDISHKDVRDVRGPVYGQVVCYMSRVRPAP